MDRGIAEQDRTWMRRALELAAAADYRTSPNPMVGAVVLDAAGRPAGEGFHRRAGQPHAEVGALAEAGDGARGGTAYVSLEPCAHLGRTPPCAEALLRAGVRRVVVAMEDPDARVQGRGLALLRGAGVAVTLGVEEAAARRLNEFYVAHRATGRPFVTAKFAISLDGKTATRAGQARWISGEESRRHAHLLRHRHDAILVGVETVIADDPELTTRLPDLADPRQPLRVVLDSHLRTSPGAKLWGPNTLLATIMAKPSRHAGPEFVTLPADAGGRVDLGALLDLLGGRNLLSVLVEGGSRVHGSFFAAGLVDKVEAYVAPMVIGGNAAPGPVGDPGAADLASCPRLDRLQVTPLGADLLLSGYVVRPR